MICTCSYVCVHIHKAEQGLERGGDSFFLDELVREVSPQGYLSRDLDDLREESKTRPGAGAFQQREEPEQEPYWMGLVCLRTGKETRVGE